MDEDRLALNEKILTGAYHRPAGLSGDLLRLIASMIEARPASRATLAAIK
jgi:hypothetical protein